MGWKDWPLWIKGGFIGLFYALISTILLYSGSEGSAFIMSWLNVHAILLMNSIAKILSIPEIFTISILSIPIILFANFLVGAVIGDIIHWVFFRQTHKFNKIIITIYILFIFCLLIVFYFELSDEIKQQFLLCDSIKDETVKNQCYFSKVYKTNDISLCNKITNIYEQRACSVLPGRPTS